MSKASFLHLADLHLDSPFESVSYLPSSLKANLRDASLLAFENAVSFAITEGVDAVVIAGDIYDGARLSTRAQVFFKEQLQLLSSAGISSILIHGNHDLVQDWSMVTVWPEKVKFFSSNDVDFVSLTSKDGEILKFIGSGGVYSDFESLKVDLEGCLSSDQNGGSGVKVFILHADVQGGSASLGNYTCIPLRELVSLPVDYLALGHIHQYLELSTNPRVVYPGTIQGRSIKPAECGEKGGVLVKIENGQIVKTEFKSFSQVEFKQLEIKVDQVLSESDFILAIKSSIKEQVVLCEKPQILRLSIETYLENRKSFNLKSREEEFLSTLREVVFRELNSSVERVKWVDVKEISSPLATEILEQVENIISSQLLSKDEIVREILKQESPLKGIDTDLSLETVLDGARDRIKSLLGCANE